MQANKGAKEEKNAPDTWNITPATNTFSQSAGPTEEEEQEEILPIEIPTDDVTLANVLAQRAEAQFELDATWKKLAAPPQDENGNVAPLSPGTLRAVMAEQRQKHMPVSRWLRKLVERLDELAAVLEEGKGSMMALDTVDRMKPAAERDADAEKAGNGKVQDALKEDHEESVNSRNLMHTTKQYNLITNLRKRLGFSIKTTTPSKSVTHADELTEREKDELGCLYGDWNKSILVSKKGKEPITLGGQGTFKEFRADPWERMAVAKAKK